MAQTQTIEKISPIQEFDTKKISLVSILKTLLFIVPIFMIFFQFLIVGGIVNNFVSPFKSQTVVLIGLLCSQFPNLTVYRRMLALELFPALFAAITALSIIDPLSNFIFVYISSLGLLDYMGIAFTMLVIGTNIFFLLIFIGVLILYRRRLYSVFLTMVIAVGIAIVVQFPLIANIVLPIDNTLIITSSFTSPQLALMVVAVAWNFISSVIVFSFIRWRNRRLVIFNRVGRYSLAGIMPIPLALIAIGAFRIITNVDVTATPAGYLEFKDYSLLVVIIFSAVILLGAAYLIFANIRFNLAPSTIKFTMMGLTSLALIGSAIIYLVTSSDIFANISIITIGSVSIISHMMVSSLREASQREVNFRMVLEINYLVTLLLLGIYIIVILLRYDIVISESLFSPNLLFIGIEIIIISVILVAHMRERSLALSMKGAK